MRGTADVMLEAPVRIVAVRRKRVTVEFPDGRRDTLSEGDVLHVRIDGSFKIGDRREYEADLS